jgi:DNA invertase Pin-like site-specific DNA recombinase
MREERDQAMAIMTATITATVTEAITEALPALVQAALPSGVATADTRPGPATPRQLRGPRQLTRRQAAARRAKRASGAPIKALMQDFGLSRATVHRYLKPPPSGQRSRARKGAPGGSEALWHRRPGTTGS